MLTPSVYPWLLIVSSFENVVKPDFLKYVFQKGKYKGYKSETLDAFVIIYDLQMYNICILIQGILTMILEILTNRSPFKVAIKVFSYYLP